MKVNTLLNQQFLSKKSNQNKIENEEEIKLKGYMYIKLFPLETDYNTNCQYFVCLTTKDEKEIIPAAMDIIYKALTIVEKQNRIIEMNNEITLSALHYNIEKNLKGKYC